MNFQKESFFVFVKPSPFILEKIRDLILLKFKYILSEPVSIEELIAFVFFS